MCRDQIFCAMYLVVLNFLKIVTARNQHTYRNGTVSYRNVFDRVVTFLDPYQLLRSNSSEKKKKKVYTIINILYLPLIKILNLSMSAFTILCPYIVIVYCVEQNLQTGYRIIPELTIEQCRSSRGKRHEIQEQRILFVHAGCSGRKTKCKGVWWSYIYDC